MAEIKCFLVLLFISFVTKKFVDNIVPGLYMDEVFHVPQAQRYWNGNYSWDPKITTLPGLYVTSKLVLGFFSIIGLLDNSCSIASLRLMNALGLGFSYTAMFKIITVKRPDLSQWNRAFAALTLSIFPLHYFFGFLYYTDVLSTLLILCMMCFSMFQRIKLSALFGALAVFTRQTNIIWIVMQIIITVWDVFELEALPELQRFMSKSQVPVPKSDKKKQRPGGKKSNNHGKKETGNSKTLIPIYIKCCRQVFPLVNGYGVIMLAFGAFVYFNGSIAVGDKDAHQATINIPQVIYFGLFAGFFMSPALFPMRSRTLKTIRTHWIGFLLACAAGLLAVHYNNVIHPYLLADNRHYTFYIWKRLYEWYPFLKYLLVPASIAAWCGICIHLDLHPALAFSYIFCICAVLIPQRLLEFRYFIVPYFLLRFEMDCLGWKHLIPEFILYLLINVLTIYIFLNKPFYWPDSDEVQRFMW